MPHRPVARPALIAIYILHTYHRVNLTLLRFYNAIYNTEVCRQAVISYYGLSVRPPTDLVVVLCRLLEVERRCELCRLMVAICCETCRLVDSWLQFAVRPVGLSL